jgi:flavin reductase (DIM6/NTAB) family NADH-FMN oxidoreductase RutF
MIITKTQISEMEKLYRVKLINSLSGFKSANLIGTINNKGITNLALFSSVIHVGANPPLMGVLFRPLSAIRHTYDNIKEMKHFTINHVNKSIYQSAHQTSARYDENTSEFSACGLTEEYSQTIKAPYVKESNIKIALEYVEEHHIKANDTVFLVGEILEAILPENIVKPDGYVDIEFADTLTTSALDGYHETKLINRFMSKIFLISKIN